MEVESAQSEFTYITNGFDLDVELSYHQEGQCEQIFTFLVAGNRDR